MGSTLNKQNVLIVDDEYLARQSVKIMLQKRDSVGEVFEAENGSQALDVYKKKTARYCICRYPDAGH